jgi:hypothetical protein
MKVRVHFPGLVDGAPCLPAAGAANVGPCSVIREDRFAKLRAYVATSWEIVPTLDACDVAIYPYTYHAEPAARATLERCKLARKPTILFNPTDDATQYNADWGRLYRTSLFASRRVENEVAMPAMAADLVAESGRPHVARPHVGRPTVGFVGYVGTAWKRFVYRATGRKDKVRGLDLRHRAIRSLQRCAGVDCRFIERDQFMAGAVDDEAVRKRTRQEFVDNIIDCDYGLCLRGKGNYSFRFYEALSAGRMVLFVNTDCRLPFDDRIKWRDLLVWVEESKLDEAGLAVAQAHAGMSSSALEERQRELRRLWEQWLEPSAFMRRIVEAAASGRYA